MNKSNNFYSAPKMEYTVASAQSVLCSSGTLQAYHEGNTTGWF